MSKKRSDEQLVRALKEDQPGAFDEVVQRYTPRVYSLASRLTKNPEDSEEVLQDVFVTVHRKIAAFEEKSSFSSWIYRVTMNASFMKLRKRRQEKSVAMEDLAPSTREAIESQPAESEDLDLGASRREFFVAVEEALGRLPEDYRGVFVLRDIDGLTSREVGEMLELSIPAIKSRLHRSRIMLRKRLTRFYDEYRDSDAEETRGETPGRR